MTKLSKEQYILLSNIFHKQHDEQSETETGDIPTASFAAVVGMVEEYMALREQPATQPAIEWKPGPPEEKGDYILITKRWPHPNWVVYEKDENWWDKDEVLFHIGPIPKTPDRV